MRNSYRVTLDGSNCYHAQVKRWWFPVWTEISWSYEAEKAVLMCRRHADPTFKYLGKLP